MYSWIEPSWKKNNNLLIENVKCLFIHYLYHFYYLSALFVLQNHLIFTKNNPIPSNKSHDIALNLLNITEDLYNADDDSEFDANAIPLKLMTKNSTFGTISIRDVMFNIKFENIKQFETAALCFFGNQLLKGLLIPVVTAKVASVGYQKPYYKGTCFLFCSLLRTCN